MYSFTYYPVALDYLNAIRKRMGDTLMKWERVEKENPTRMATHVVSPPGRGFIPMLGN